MIARNPACLAAFAVLVSFGGLGAGELSYLGPGRNAGSAIVRAADDRVRELRLGETIADLGELQRVEDDEIVFERQLRDEERHELRERGLVAPDVQRLHVPRQPEPSEPSDVSPASELVW
jgi:hypothetical protein